MSVSGGRNWRAWTGRDRPRGHYPGRRLGLSKKCVAQRFAEELRPNRRSGGLLLLSRRRLFAFLHRRFEILNPLAQAFTQLSQAARPKNQQGDHKNHEDLRQTQFAYHFLTSAGTAYPARSRARSYQNTY